MTCRIMLSGALRAPGFQERIGGGDRRRPAERGLQ